MSEVFEHEVIVLGGGPAGCAAAALLARDGHDVCLVRPQAPPAGQLAESIPPSARRVLAELDLDQSLTRAGFPTNAGNLAWWGGAGPRSEAFGEGRTGFHADRVGLERALVEAVSRAGVTVRPGAGREADEHAGGWQVRCASVEGTSFELRAPWVLDATGRRGLIARREGRSSDRSTTTTAIVRRWQDAAGFAGAPQGYTLVESYSNGWAWSVPLGPDVRCFTAMVDHRLTDIDEADLDATLNAELAKAPHVGALRAGARPLGGAWACPASLYSASRFARPGLVLVGDAGSFIDPLSSFGVKKAISSGWMAGVTVHTALVDPGMRDAALELYDQRERAVYRSYQGHAADFYEEAASAYGHEFWTTRAAASRAAAGPRTDMAGDADIPGESTMPVEAVRAAYERIRARERLDARRGAHVRVLERPTVVGHRVVRQHHLASSRVPRGLRYVRNVDLMRLVDIAPRHPEVPDGWSAYNAEGPAVSLPDYLTALATACAADLLTLEATS